MSEQKPLVDIFLEWLSGLISPKSSVEESGETPDKPSNQTPEIKIIEPTRSEPKTRRVNPRMRGLEEK